MVANNPSVSFIDVGYFLGPGGQAALWMAPAQNVLVCI